MSAAQGPTGTGGTDSGRVSNRARKRLMVRFGVQAPEKTGFTTNVSETGMFIRTNYVLKPGSTLQIAIDEGGSKFTLWAKVMRAKKVPAQLAHVLECGMGVRFLDPPSEWLEFCRQWRGGS